MHDAGTTLTEVIFKSYCKHILICRVETLSIRTINTGVYRICQIEFTPCSRVTLSPLGKPTIDFRWPG